MNKIKLVLGGVITLATCLALDALAQELPAEPIPLLVNQASVVPNAPTLQSKSYVLLDADTGKVLAANNPDQPLSPASTTKIQ